MFDVMKQLNDNFYKWFGNSKILDTNNEPIVMYHKSRSKELFDEFRLENVEKNQYNHHYGIYFVNAHYSHNISYIGDGLEYYVYLKIENPFIIFDFNNQPQDMLGQKLIFIDVSKEYCEDLKKKGYDGIIIKSNHYDQYIVFDPKQIKSIENNGDYKIETNNIFN
jgi:predicted transcriptional regulator